jgi:hypothetical protein
MAHGQCTDTNLGDPHGRCHLGWAVGWLAPLVLVAGCSGSPGMLLTGGIAETSSPNEQLLARPKYAAWVAASAKRCGFAREQAAVKSAYLSFEARQGIGKDELAKVEEAYNLAWKSTDAQITIDPGYCTQKKVAEIKLALRRQEASDYAPNFQKPEVVSPRPRVEEPFDSKKFWDAKDAEGANSPF